MVALEKGAKVVSKDGEEIGEVAQILVEPSDNRATHIVVAQGLLSKEHKLVPTLWITDATEEEIHLLIDSDLLEGLPEYQLA
jgi:uncharacterized protein YrrD